MTIIKVSCPKCKHQMNYQFLSGQLSDKVKRCVYCGHSFKIHSDANKSRIIKIEKNIK